MLENTSNETQKKGQREYAQLNEAKDKLTKQLE